MEVNAQDSINLTQLGELSMGYINHYKRWHDNSDKDQSDSVSNYKTLFDKHIQTIDRNNLAIDIGCAFGFGIEYLRSTGFKRVAGYDKDRDMYSICKKKSYEVYVAGDFLSFINKASIKRKSINLVLATDLIEHLSIKSAEKLLTSIKPYMASNSKIILTTPNANSFISSRYRYIDATHRVIYTPESICHIAMNAGYKTIEIYPNEEISKYPPIHSLSGFINWIEKKLLRSLQKWIYKVELGNSEANRLILSPNMIIVLSI